jgi:hypothetical protein
VSPTKLWRAAEMRFSHSIFPLESCDFSEDLRKRLRLGEQMCGCVRAEAGCAIWCAFFLPLIQPFLPKLTLNLQWESTRRVIRALRSTPDF